MFNGAFAKAMPRELVALCSMFVPTEKSNQKPTIPKKLELPIKGVLDAAKLIADTQLEQKLEIDVEKYVDSFRTFLVEIVYDWREEIFFGSFIAHGFVRRHDRSRHAPIGLIDVGAWQSGDGVW